MTDTKFRPEVGEFCRIKIGERLIRAIPSRVVMTPPAGAGVDSRHFNVVYYPYSLDSTQPELAEGVIASRLYPLTGMTKPPAQGERALAEKAGIVKPAEKPATDTKPRTGTRTKPSSDKRDMAAAAPTFSGVAELLPAAPKKAPAKKATKTAPKKAAVKFEESERVNVRVGRAKSAGTIIDVGTGDKEGQYNVMYGPRDREKWLPASVLEKVTE